MTIPVLMINGRYDFLVPVETNQEPMFRLLGTSAADKRHLLFDSGHAVRFTPGFKEALDCGFGNAEGMRRSFVRLVGVTPDQYRRTLNSAKGDP